MFVFAMVLGTGSLMAQSQIEINSLASKKTEALRKFVKFDNAQRDQVYDALKEYGQANANLTSDNTDAIAFEKIKNRLQEKIKSILSEEQYQRYKEYNKQY